MPELVKMYIRHTLIGFALSAVFVTLLFFFNIANLWHLVTHDSAGWLAAVLLVIFNGIVFSGVQFGIAIMRMADEDDKSDDSGVRPRNPVLDAATIPLRVDRPARGHAGWRRNAGHCLN